MSTHSSKDSDRWEELQVARLLFGLSPDEQAEYDEMLRQTPAGERDQFDAVVASLDLAWSDQQAEPLPEHVRQAIRIRAEQEMPTKTVVSPAKPSSRGSIATRSTHYLPWLVSATCLALAVFTWLSNRPVKTPRPDVAQLRTELIAANKDIVQANWLAGTTPIEDATGDVVWSSSQQQGFMRFRGLPVNAPAKEQYQLWIFDKNQSDKTPVDGGVFDIATTNESVVPINAKLQVQQPFMFAITIEKPGGVVVSSRERLPLLAKVE